MANISRNKGSQIMKFGPIIKYNVRNIFFKDYAENESVRLVPDLFLFFEKALYEAKASGEHFPSRHLLVQSQQ